MWCPHWRGGSSVRVSSSLPSEISKGKFCLVGILTTVWALIAVVVAVIAQGLGWAFEGAPVDVLSSEFAGTVLVLAILVALPFGLTLRDTLDDIESDVVR